MKKFGLIFLFLSLISNIYSQEGGIRFSGDVVFFEEEGEERERIYTLKVKGEINSLSYPVIRENDKNYFSIFEFFRAINFTNYTIEKGRLTFRLGNYNQEEIIDFSKLNKNEYIYENRDYYISQELFKKYFAESIRLNEKKYEININTSFLLPKMIDLLLNAKEKELLGESEKPVLYYTAKRVPFDLGNMRVNYQRDITKKSGERTKYDWNGYLEYSGSLLYGEFRTDYDLKTHELGDMTITYSNLLRGEYELELGLYGEHRLGGLSFTKDRGYYNDGKNYIITEKVPLGSRVELLYNNVPIEIEYENGGEVTFINNLIKENREFLMRIYTQDGKIEERKIKINDDYNQQNKGEFGFDIYIRDEHESDRVNSQWDIYYGYTDNLTFGFGLEQTPEEIEGKYISLRTASFETIYGNSWYGNPYTFTYELRKGLNMAKSFFRTYEGKYYDRKYNNQHRFMFDTTIKDLRVNYEWYENGKYYDSRREQNLDLDYDLTDWLSLTYEYEDTKYYNRESENDYRYGLEIGYSPLDSLLLSYDVEKNKKGDIVQSVDVYYTGFKHVIAKVQNNWDENGDYTAELTLTNKTWSDVLEYSIGATYEPDRETKFMLDFTLKLENWLELGTYWAKNETKSAYIGIDRVINLKHPLVNMNNIDSTTIKTIAFLDGNNNNIMDKDEERVADVDIKLGQDIVTTDENGIAYIYGVASYIDYELETSPKRPTYKTDKNIIKVRGTGSSEIVAYIPVKPMISFEGMISLPEFSEFDFDNIIGDIAIIITNKDRTFSQTIYPDSSGVFYLFDITPDDYTFGIEYRGEDYKVENYRKDLKLIYTNENRGDNEYNFILKRGE